MKKIFKSGAIIIAAALLVYAGVYAVTTRTFSMGGSTVSFASSEVYVDITGSLTGYAGILDNNTYSGKTYTSVSSPNTGKNSDVWNMGNVNLDNENYTLTLTLNFTNNGDVPVIVTITLPANLSVSSLSLTGGLAGANDVDVSETIDFEETATFIYTVTLTNFNKNVNAASFNFSAEMTPDLS